MNHYESERPAAGKAVDAGLRPESSTAVAGLAERLYEVLPRTVRRMRRETRTRFGRDLTVPQVRAVLFLRRHPGSGLSALAEHLGISSPAASVMVDVLVGQGLAMRSRDPDERRRIRLSLTEDGTATAVQARAAARGWLSDVLGEIGADDRATLEAAVVILDRLTEARA